MVAPADTRRAMEIALHAPQADIGRRVGEFMEDMLDGVASVGFTVGEESGGNVIRVNVQAKNEKGDDVSQRVVLDLILLADANGDAFNAQAYTTIAAGTDGALLEVVANKVLKGITEADGDLDVDITLGSGGATCYLAAVGPNGKLIGVSGAITHAA